LTTQLNTKSHNPILAQTKRKSIHKECIHVLL